MKTIRKTVKLAEVHVGDRIKFRKHIGIVTHIERTDTHPRIEIGTDVTYLHHIQIKTNTKRYPTWGACFADTDECELISPTNLRVELGLPELKWPQQYVRAKFRVTRKDVGYDARYSTADEIVAEQWEVGVVEAVLHIYGRYDLLVRFSDHPKNLIEQVSSMFLDPIH